MLLVPHSTQVKVMSLQFSEWWMRKQLKAGPQPAPLVSCYGRYVQAHVDLLVGCGDDYLRALASRKLRRAALTIRRSYPAKAAEWMARAGQLVDEPVEAIRIYENALRLCPQHEKANEWKQWVEAMKSGPSVSAPLPASAPRAKEY